MIEYVEVRGLDTEIIGIIDVARSVIWRSLYYGVGDFEIYAQATPATLDLLRVGRYVTRPDNEEIGVIESINISSNEQDGIMITAAGRFVKSILDRRIIYNFSGAGNAATVLRGNVEAAVRRMIYTNAIDCDFDAKRNIPLFKLAAEAGITLKIVDAYGNDAAKQVTHENLLAYTEGVLEEYGLSATCKLRGGFFEYGIYQGIDRSTDNASGNIPIVFSREFDNLTESTYSHDTTAEKNFALIGGEGEGAERIYSFVEGSEDGLNRREVFIDANSIKTKYKETNDLAKHNLA